MSSSPNLPTSRSALSLSPDNPASAARAREGRTPPPAPSAAYARRAREIMEDETGLPSLKPPVTEDAGVEAEEVVGSVAAGYRRARAGTMPSSLQDASQRYAAPSETSPSNPVIPNQSAPVRTSASSPAYPTTPTSRPASRHTASSAANLETPVPANGNRHRSGSLTLPQPPANLGSAFSSSPFSSTWLSNPGPARSPLAPTDPSDESEDLSSFSPSADGPVNDELNFSTSAHLGLTDGQELPPASVSGMREQAQRAIANNGPASRHRASTLSNFNRPIRPSITTTSSSASYYNESEEAALARAIGELGMYDEAGYDQTGGYLSAGYGNPAHRPRATTIGALDNPHRRALAPHGYLSSIPQSPVQGGYMQSLSMTSAYGYPPRSRSDRDLTRSRDSSSSRGPRLSISSHTSRAGTPDANGTSTPQMPTRSSWIGNLDVNATSEASLHVFAPYGAIESVRMLPEKTCAFVNFMEKGDAVRARDDVLNRLGGHVPALSETAPVRIGFGKIDSAPNGPPASSVTPAPTGLVFTQGGSGPASTTPISMVIPPANPNVDLSNEEHSSDLPTRALWIGSIPGTTSSSTLLQIFSPFGPVESARVLMHKACGFINFERLDSAIAARTALNGRDILGSDVGPIRIGFARVPTKSPTIGSTEDAEAAPGSKLTEQLATVNGAAAVSTETQVSAEGGGSENYRSQSVVDSVKAGVHEQVSEKGLANGGEVTEQQMIMQVSSANREEDGDIKAAAEPRAPATYYSAIPLITERPQRRFDSVRLKDSRKRLDSSALSVEEVDAITIDSMEDTAELASDYIGNTVVQKLFERTSPHLRFAMLERIVPHLAIIGIHKNGTWAAQKVIECSVTPEERALICTHLRPFAPPSMCDSLGNYVCAGTLRFGSPWSDYVFDAMMDRMWDIAQNRFGARCMRTCLESPHTSLYQKKRIATGIISNSIPSATNPNGALSLTWSVDQSNLPGRYGLSAGRFVSHIAHLCTHKLASSTVLRIITQTAEPGAAHTLINGIFTSTDDATSTEISSDANNGAQVIGKILAISSSNVGDKETMIEATRRVLPGIKASSTPPYRMSLEAVGLPVPAGQIGGGGFNVRGWQGHQQQPRQNNYNYQYSYGNSTPGSGHQAMSFGAMGQNMSPHLMSQNMSLNHSLRGGSPNSGQGSPRTPVARHQGRLSPGSQMMSPGSDPFNPFASPSIDAPYMNTQSGVRMASSSGHGPITFEQQPNLGGSGIMPPQGSQGYYQSNMTRPGMFAGYQA